jgi:hypothetical protein
MKFPYLADDDRAIGEAIDRGDLFGAAVAQSRRRARQAARWGVWCEVWSVLHGTREAWLKRNDTVAQFATCEEAEAEAERNMRRVYGNPHRVADFRYSAREFRS